MTGQLLDVRMYDGSRHFGDLPQTVLWDELAQHITRMPGATGVQVLTDHVTEGWIEFGYRGYHLSINDQFGSYWFFVDDPECPEQYLSDVLEYCSQLLRG